MVIDMPRLVGRYSPRVVRVGSPVVRPAISLPPSAAGSGMTAVANPFAGLVRVLEPEVTKASGSSIGVLIGYNLARGFTDRHNVLWN